ncbi:MAG: phenylalanine--tRNA ligase subunit beta [Rhodocyclaceae bacterium]|nr:phenylalanine--tRNA ligase subunit beta [Rhodocyclaceae bacterium]
MQFPESWLREFIDPPLSSEELCHLLTMAGLEVEEQKPVAPKFHGVVVARVLAVEKHPHADRLKLCQVDAGAHGVLSIVCGAPNVEAGLHVPCALPGAKLPGGEIKVAKVRGIDSYGMLCSARELGLAEDHDGIMTLPGDAPLGKDLRQYLALDDQIITLKLTPNRADCLSLKGLARELMALTGVAAKMPEIQAVAPTIADVRAIVLDAPEACPRYCGRVIADVNAAAPTPEWMKARLLRCGVRSISALVDITNYVMLELGQPLHAFDDEKLVGAIHVRYPRAGERLLLLNGQTVEPAADVALIADDEKALALAGIMGGEESGVGLSTRRVFLESAFFSPSAIAGRARALGFSSDAAHRFERGVDFALQRAALERATALILAICGGKAGPLCEAESLPHLPTRQAIRLSPARASRLLGIELTLAQCERLLTGLGLAPRQEADALVVMPPTWRFDLAIEEDLVEELARLHGYENIPAHPPSAQLSMRPQPEAQRSPYALRRQLAARGYYEVINYSFVPPEWEADLAGNDKPVRLANPIASHLAVMRSSLIGGLVGVLQTNLKRQLDRVRLFEIGRCFSPDATAETGHAQPMRLGMLAAGEAYPLQWGLSRRPVDFFDLKGDIEALFAPARIESVAFPHPALHPGRSARILLAGRSIGILGELHPLWRQKYEIPVAVVVAELDLDALLRHDMPHYQEISRFPAVVRDLALIVEVACSASALVDTLRRAAPGYVRDVSLFDVYQGKGVTEGKKSLAFRITMQDTQKTLSDHDADAAIKRMLDAAFREHGAMLRQ